MIFRILEEAGYSDAAIQDGAVYLAVNRIGGHASTR